MRTTGIREARQNLSALLEEVARGHELILTDRGRPVARLVPPARSSAGPYPGRKAFRETMPHLVPPLSAAILEDREERG